MLSRIVIASFSLLTTAPALASGAAPVPEASNLTLFALGAAGVLIGRRLSMHGKDD